MESAPSLPRIDCIPLKLIFPLDYSLRLAKCGGGHLAELQHNLGWAENLPFDVEKKKKAPNLN